MSDAAVLFDELAGLLRALRAPGGCPWDREQTISDIAEYVLDEAFECHQAALFGSPADLADELGDVLLQVVFMSQIASEEGTFNLADVVRGIAEKITRRHPHIFGEAIAETSSEVTEIWEKVKKKEGKQATVSLPALEQARKLQLKAENKGYESPDSYRRLREAVDRLTEKPVSGNDPRLRQSLQRDLGDVLFAAIRVGSEFGLIAEQVLRKKNEDFQTRLTACESEKDAGKRAGNKLWENS